MNEDIQSFIMDAGEDGQGNNDPDDLQYLNPVHNLQVHT